MEFHDLEAEFGEVIDRHSVASRDSRALLEDIRLASSEAGQRLVAAIKQDQIQVPESPGFWMRFALEIDLERRYVEARSSGGRLWSSTRNITAGILITYICYMQKEVDLWMDEDAHHSSIMRHIHRHVFYEAVIEWISVLENGARGGPTLPFQVLVPDEGDDVRVWQKALEQASGICEVWPQESFIVAFAAFELELEEMAIAHFLHGALNQPRVARMLVGERCRKPQGLDETRDHNDGVAMRRSLSAYLGKRRQRRSRFFRGLLETTQVQAMLDEIHHVRQRHSRQHARGQREAFDRIQEMGTMEYANARAREIAPKFLLAGW